MNTPTDCYCCDPPTTLRAGVPQVWDRSNTSDALLGTARVHITDALSSGDKNGWYKLVGTGDQVTELNSSLPSYLRTPFF